MESATGTLWDSIITDDKWKCDTCSLRWEKDLIKCKACESFRPGLTEAELANLQAAEENRKAADIAKFLSPAASAQAGGSGFPAAPKPTGFSFGAPAEGSASASPSIFGSGTSIFGAGVSSGAAPLFGFGTSSSPPADAPPLSTGGFVFGSSSSPPQAAGGFVFGGASSSPPQPSSGLLFGASSSPAPTAGGFVFGGPAAAEVVEEKKLDTLPDLSGDALPIGDVFVHGSGECDQLGLGDNQRERQKPTILKVLSSVNICELSVGALHVLCVSDAGRLFSWGCNDDGALGRAAGDADCEAHPVEAMAGVAVRSVSCGDCHSCALDNHGRVWLWGAYKDSNGHIGISQKRKHDAVVLEKTSDPAVVLESCCRIASGANHTVALGTGQGKVYAWGSNATGQLGLEKGEGCGFSEKYVDVKDMSGKLQNRGGGGTEAEGMRLVRLVDASGDERSAINMKAVDVELALTASVGGTATEVVRYVLEVPERDVPKAERKALLDPQEVYLGKVDSTVTGVFASQDCTFVTTSGGLTYGCGLNGDAQVGIGFISMVVQTLRLLPGVTGASWLGGGQHASAALVKGQVFTWGKEEECGHGSKSTAPMLVPRLVSSLPKVRNLRCGGHHMLACTEAGDAFVWGCGLTHQLGNRPRKFEDKSDADEDPEDELKPYRMSSKQLDGRFVLLADGGAQHSVELAWNGKYGRLAEPEAAIESSMSGAEIVDEPALKRAKHESEVAASVEEACKPAVVIEVSPEAQGSEQDSVMAGASPQTESAANSEEISIPNTWFTLIADDKWKCDVCSLRWAKDLMKCGACEAFRPGLSEADVAEAKAADEQQKQADIAKFLGSGSSGKPGASTGSGFSFGTGAPATASSGFTFGAAAPAGTGGFAFGFGSAAASDAASSSGFTFGSAAPAPDTSATQPPASGFIFSSAASQPSSGGFTFGSAAAPAADALANQPAASGFSFGSGSSQPQPGGFIFGSGASQPQASTFSFGGSPALSSPPVLQEKKLEVLPDFTRSDKPIGDVFVHGSGECDQLGLGDEKRERQKPTIIPGLSNVKIFDVAVGALHVLCVAAGGRMYSWGCNDDGALGRPSEGTSDCEPHLVAMPEGVVVRSVSCGDGHSCALDNVGRAWLWGTYKDSNGHIGIAQKRKQTPVLEKSAEPAVVLEGCIRIASGANHTVALAHTQTDAADSDRQPSVFTWGSNGTGQLGLSTGEGCGFAEKVVLAADLSADNLRERHGGGSEAEFLDQWLRAVRIVETNGKQKSAMYMKLDELKQALAAGVQSIVFEFPEREVPKTEKKTLLIPHAAAIDKVEGTVSGVFASAECTFVISPGGSYGCGLNGDGQVGLGFISMVVPTLRLLPAVKDAVWIGGGLHTTAALIGGQVHTWGKAEECGHGLGPTVAPLMEPRVIANLPSIRNLRCGGHHMLATSHAGDVWMWGCGLTHQLGNRPRDFADTADKDEDPDDELKPYRVSSKQLETRFVLLAAGGAQHSVELAWDGAYAKLADTSSDQPQNVAQVEVGADEPAHKRSRPTPVDDAVSTAPAVKPSSVDEPPPLAAATSSEVPSQSEAEPPSLWSSMAVDDRWKCDTCSLRWEMKHIKCQACESYRPGLSDADVAAMKAEEEKKKLDDIAKFTSPASSGQTGFSFSSAPASTGFSFATAGTGLSAFGAAASTTSEPAGFNFGASTSSQTAPIFGAPSTNVPATSFAFGTASSAQPAGSSIFGATPSSSSSFSFGSASTAPAVGGFVFGSPPPQALVEKKLAILPDFTRKDVPLADVFVHGSGECDQLGLGDDQRERKKPTIIPMLSSVHVYNLAVGALHVLCVTTEGRVYSWGCNDDGALGRPSEGTSDCEPHLTTLPADVVAQKVTCGDNHSCALDNLGRAWLWGTYKDSNGHIGIAEKCPSASGQGGVLLKTDKPAVVLDGCTDISSGANHTVAKTSTNVVFAWGSNGTGQLGVPDGCGFAEERVSVTDALKDRLLPRSAGGVELDGKHVVRIVEISGTNRSAMAMKVEEVAHALGGAKALVLEVPEREVPKPEKQKLLYPQQIDINEVGGAVAAVFASAECTFITAEGKTYGCGLNGDGQVGLGFVSMVVRTPQLLPNLKKASWLGGGLHSSVALVEGQVFTWGKAEECGHGLGATAPPLMEPRAITGLPETREVRCGGHHMLATTNAGDVFVWGCGLTYQLANRPRDVSKPGDKDEDPDDELKPYQVSSKQLASRFVLLAAGGAQHSVELAWNGSYGSLVGSSRQCIDEQAVADETAQRATTSDTATTQEDLNVDVEMQAAPSLLWSGSAADDRWKCGTCSLRWDMKYIKCQACESYRPGLSDADVAAMKAEEDRKKEDDIAKFRTPVSSAPTGFSFASATSSGTGAFAFGAPSSTTSAPVGFSFGTSAPSQTPPLFGMPSGNVPATSFAFGAGSSAQLGGSSMFGATPSSSSSFSFGSAPAASATGGFVFGSPPQQALVEKKLTTLPDFTRRDVPLADVFVHGSGECDQLGLGDDMRERKKPTIMPSLSSVRVYNLAVGALHVLCVTAEGRIYSWGCNDDGALGRPSEGTSDCEPHLTSLPADVVARKVTCGDNHSCALDNLGRAWLWGTYKDANGHIGIAQKCPSASGHGVVLEKTDKPAVVLEGCTDISSGANHTVAKTSTNDVFTWGSNGCGQLGVPDGCGFAEQSISATNALKDKLLPRAGGGVELDGKRVVRIVETSGTNRSTMVMKVEEVVQALSGAKALVLEVPEREVPKPEKQKLLHPQRMDIGEVGGVASAVFASAECTFITAEGKTYGCGLNGDGQVGLGFISMAVRTPQLLPSLKKASWLGGGLHSSVALVEGQVYTWGKAEECGHGLGATAPPLLEPRVITGLPETREVRCGGHHMLATTNAGDVFVWGCGLTYQLGNRPRDVSKPGDKNEDPEDELKPYQISSKQLGSRFVLLAAGGAQHSVELAWNGSYGDLAGVIGQTDDAQTAADLDIDMQDGQREEVVDFPITPFTKAVALANVEEDEEEAAAGLARAEAEVLRLFTGQLLSELSPGTGPRRRKVASVLATASRVLWSPLQPAAIESEVPAQAPASLPKPALLPAGKLADLRLHAQVASLRRRDLEELVMDTAQRDGEIREAVLQRFQKAEGQDQDASLPAIVDIDAKDAKVVHFEGALPQAKASEKKRSRSKSVKKPTPSKEKLRSRSKSLKPAGESKERRSRSKSGKRKA